jgi:hypothetical protein
VEEKSMTNPWTPGPYFRDQRCIYALQGPDGKQEDRWAFVIMSAGKCPPDELDAVAALMHAAPEMAEALDELAGDLAEYVQAHYGDHPSQKARKERDLAPVVAARALLALIRGEAA